MCGCLNMYIDWRSSGLETERSEASCASLLLRENRPNTGSRSCNACPILLIECSLLCLRVPSALKAFSSKKKLMLFADARKYSSAIRFCSLVEKIETSSAGSNSDTSVSARARKRSQSVFSQKASSTMKPSSENFCCSLSDIKVYLSSVSFNLGEVYTSICDRS